MPNSLRGGRSRYTGAGASRRSVIRAPGGLAAPVGHAPSPPCQRTPASTRRCCDDCHGHDENGRHLEGERLAVPGWRVLQVEAGRAGYGAELVADVGAVEARGLLGEELARLAAQGVAEHRVHHGFRQRAELLQ